MNKIEQFDESLLISNPFSYGTYIPVTEIVSNMDFKIDPEDGIVYNKTFYLENIKSTKIYHCDSCKDIIYNLSGAAQRLYLYIIYNIKEGKDYIQINQEHFQKKNNVKSLNTYKVALKELLRYAFIASTEFKSVFWINPNLFFSGNRLKKFPGSIKEIGRAHV